MLPVSASRSAYRLKSPGGASLSFLDPCDQNANAMLLESRRVFSHVRAVQLSQGETATPIFTPEEGYNWKIAKACFEATDFMSVKLNRVHVLELALALALAVERTKLLAVWKSLAGWLAGWLAAEHGEGFECSRKYNSAKRLLVTCF